MKKSTIYFIITGCFIISAISHFVFQTKLTPIHEAFLYLMGTAGLFNIALTAYENGD